MIDIENITFHYQKNKEVFNNFSLQFKDGGIYGLLGKNGVGKSTLLYLVSGLLRPKAGEIKVDGFIPHKREVAFLRDIFIVPEEFALPNVSLNEYLSVLRPFYPGFSDEILLMALGEFDMNKDIDLKELSMGEAKKVYMAIALAANTRVLLMDEPTNGLDILSKSQFRKAVIAGMRYDKIVIISTHQVHDVENLLDNVVIIGENGVLLERSLDEEIVNLEQLFVSTVEE